MAPTLGGRVGAAGGTRLGQPRFSFPGQLNAPAARALEFVDVGQTCKVGDVVVIVAREVAGMLGSRVKAAHSFPLPTSLCMIACLGFYPPKQAGG